MGPDVFAQSTPSVPFVATLTSESARLKRLCQRNSCLAASTQRILVIAASSMMDVQTRRRQLGRVSLRLKEDKDARSGSDGRVLRFFAVSPTAPHHGNAVCAAAHALFEIGRKDSAERRRPAWRAAAISRNRSQQRDCIRVRPVSRAPSQHDEVDS